MQMLVVHSAMTEIVKEGMCQKEDGSGEGGIVKIPIFSRDYRPCF